MMRQLMMTLMGLILSIGAMAQSADALYKEGKALYDEKKYQQAFPKLKAAAEKATRRHSIASVSAMTRERV